MIAFHIFEAFCQDPLFLYYIPKPYKETPIKRQSGYAPFSLLIHLYNDLIIDKLLADIIPLL